VVEGLLPAVGGLELGRREVADRLKQVAVVEPVDPCQGGQLDLLGGAPWAAAADQLGLVQPDDRLGERVVVAVTAGADRGDSALVGEALGVAGYCPGSRGCRNTGLVTGV